MLQEAVADGMELLDFPLGGFAVSDLLLFATVFFGVFFFLFLYIFFNSLGSTGSAKYSSSVDSRLSSMETVCFDFWLRRFFLGFVGVTAGFWNRLAIDLGVISESISILFVFCWPLVFTGVDAMGRGESGKSDITSRY